MAPSIVKHSEYDIEKLTSPPLLTLRRKPYNQYYYLLIMAGEAPLSNYPPSI